MIRAVTELPEESLSPSEENFLANEIQHHKGNDDAVNRLTLHSMREAVRYATKCCRGALREPELFSLCYAALMKAARNFKPDNIRFFAYAKVYVRGELARYWKNADVVRASSLHQSEDTPEIRRHWVHTIMGHDMEQVVIEDAESIEDDFIEPEFEAIDLREKLRVVLPLIESKLNERERTVLKLYYESGFAFEAIGAMLVPSVSRAAVQSTHGRALRKLQCALVRSHQLEM